MEIKKADLEAMSREINHLADIMDVTELSNEAMKYVAAMGAWLRNNIEKLDMDEQKALIAMTTLNTSEKLKEATTKIHESCMEIKISFIALETVKGGVKNESNN